jgi:hypothetical protein
MSFGDNSFGNFGVKECPKRYPFCPKVYASGCGSSSSSLPCF